VEGNISIQTRSNHMPITTKEEAFADLIRDYENLWVAIAEKDGAEFIAGSGLTAVNAVNEATEKGYPEAMLFKVPSFKTRFVL
jgi:hypothetical protein